MNKTEYYRKWNKEHREMKREWMRRKRKGLIPDKITDRKWYRNTTQERTSGKRLCCWCGMEKEKVFCSKKCEQEYNKFN